MDDEKARERYSELEQYFQDNNVFWKPLGNILHKKTTEYPDDTVAEIIEIPDVFPYGPIEAQGTDPLYILLIRPKTLSMDDIKKKFIDTLGADYRPHVYIDFDWLIGWILHVACTDEENRYAYQ